MSVFSRSTGTFLAGAAFGLMALASTGQAQEQKQINLLVPNENTTVFFPMIVARELGFFEDEGLNVNMLSSATTVPYVAFLSNRQADVAMLDAPQTLQAVNAGVPISVVYEAQQFAPEVVAVPVDSPIQSVTELQGKTVGLASDRDRVTLQVALDAVGAPADSVETVVVGDAGPTMATAIKDGSVAAVSAAINDLATLEGIGIKVRDITPPEVSENPANSFVIAKDRAEELRPALTAFLRAWAKGAAAADIDPEVVAALARQSVPEEWANREAGESLFQVARRLNDPQTEQFGGLQPDVWKKVQGPLVKFGELQQEYDPATFLDGSFIEEANNFDRNEIKTALEEWKAAHPDLMK
jgi:NitT/TauT family transport system substrate-binding protein